MEVSMDTCKPVVAQRPCKSPKGRIVVRTASASKGCKEFLVTYERNGRDPIVLKKLVNGSEARALAESAQAMADKATFGTTDAATLFDCPSKCLWVTEQTAAAYVLLNNREARKQVSDTLTALAQCNEEVQNDLLKTVYFSGSSEILDKMDSTGLASTVQRVAATRDPHIGLTSLVLEYVIRKMDSSFDCNEVDWVQLAQSH